MRHLNDRKLVASKNSRWMFAVWQQVGNKLFIRSGIRRLRLSCLLDRRPPLTWRRPDTCCACERFKRIPGEKKTAWYQRENLKPKLRRMSLKSEMWAEHRWKWTSEAEWCIWVKILPTASSPRPRAAVRPAPGFQACVGLTKGNYRSVPDPLPKRFTQRNDIQDSDQFHSLTQHPIKSIL